MADETDAADAGSKLAGLEAAAARAAAEVEDAAAASRDAPSPRTHFDLLVKTHALDLARALLDRAARAAEFAAADRRAAAAVEWAAPGAQFVLTHPAAVHTWGPLSTACIVRIAVHPDLVYAVRARLAEDGRCAVSVHVAPWYTAPVPPYARADRRAAAWWSWSACCAAE